MAIDPKDLSIHDEIVVETEIDGAVVRLSAFVTNVLADELWLATRLPEPRLLNLEEGLPIHLTFDRDVQDLKLDASNSGTMTPIASRAPPSAL